MKAPCAKVSTAQRLRGPKLLLAVFAVLCQISHHPVCNLVPIFTQARSNLCGHSVKTGPKHAPVRVRRKTLRSSPTERALLQNKTIGPEIVATLLDPTLDPSSSCSGEDSVLHLIYNREAQWDRQHTSLAYDDSDEVEERALSNEQDAAAQRALKKRENLFITGPAGTGKSVLLRYIIREMRKMWGEGSVAVTAPTGIAAVNIGGETIHRFAGIGTRKGSTEQVVARVLRSSKARFAWQDVKVLVIDEVSMVSAELFDLLDAVACSVRNDTVGPFGGIQLILCGDFFQLPPISYSPRPFAFQAAAWSRAGLDSSTIMLSQIHRQANDQAFQEVLNELRRGDFSSKTKSALAECQINAKGVPKDGIIPTKLYCRNRDVDAENSQRLAELSGGVKFDASDRFEGGSGTQQKFLRGMMDKKVDAVLKLKIGAQVVLLRNLDKDLANGSRGVVESFSFEDGKYRPKVRFDCVEEPRQIDPITFSLGIGTSMVRTQIPLKLAWAMTVHRSQGSTISRVEVMLDGAFACGQVYVALSRVKNRAGLWMRTELSQKDVRANRDVLDFYGLSGAA